jgi:FKBP-type peptidyl-prolyl cis-trans isomerase
VTRRRTALLAAPAALALLLSGCGSSSDDDGGGSAASPTCTQADPTAQPPSSVSADLGTEPEVPATDAAPPCGLVVADVVVGDGAVAASGSPVEVKYVGAFYDSGQVFDASWNRGADETLPFTAGTGQVIEGFDQGVIGMAVGGRRYITIPSDLGYGANGQGPIPGGATLVFVVDLVSAG